MQPKKRMKMCSNCDGMVDLDVIICPYCGHDLSASMSQTADGDKNQTPPLEETLSALYPPPYKPKSFASETAEEKPEEMHSLENISPSNPVTFENMETAASVETPNPVEAPVEPPVSHESTFTEKVESQTAAMPIKEEPTEEEMHQKKTILATLLFSLGINLLFFSLFLLFFSTNGELFLRWDGGLWYLYSLLGIGMLAGGYKLLGKLTS